MNGPLARLDSSTPDAGIGAEARRLRWLMASGVPVPETWVVPGGLADWHDAEAALTVLDPHRRYVVRPSAEGEEAEWGAGQSAALFGVAGLGLAAAVDEARGSRPSGRVERPVARPGNGPGLGGMAVIVQEVVEAAASGVAFSRNPMTGLDEVVVEASAGSGERPGGEGVIAARWAHRWGAFVAAPDHPPLPEETVAEIVEATRTLARAYGGPVELEWAWDGSRVWWVRLCPLTGLDRITVYSNRISKEVMPGIIKPLVWSVNVPMVNGAWIRLFTEAIGRNDLRADDLAKAFAYRSYFNMSAIGGIFRLLGMPRDSLELLLGLEGGDARPRLKPTAATVRRLPRMLVVAIGKLGFGATIRRALPALRRDFARFPAADLARLTDQELVAQVGALMEIGSRAAYFNIVAPLLANLYTGMLRRRLAAAGIDFATFDLTAGLAGMEAYNPGLHLARLGEMAAVLDEGTRARLAAGGFRELSGDLRGEFDRFLAAFGHLSDSGNDFSSVPWREDPDLLVAMVLARGVSGPPRGRSTWEEARSATSPLRRPALRFFYRRSRGFVVHREAVSSTYTYGYGLFRPVFLEIGRRLRGRGALRQPDDVMYLYLDELKGALLGGDQNVPALSLVAQRRAEIEELRDVVMPEVIFGDDFVPGLDVARGAPRLSGTPTSRGRHTGVARVIRSVAEFDRVAPGDVVVIPYSDVSWTPLLARAGAVVAESGGMLSHSSIVAREYGLPCVVSVDGAMRLSDGATVTVDGYTGEVMVAEGGERLGR